ncbi:MAG: cytochrome c [Burkholderiales bacterium]|jgi:cytochrome c55X|nr:cytochrome c [Burkholderiales bacterium]
MGPRRLFTAAILLGLFAPGVPAATTEPAPDDMRRAALIRLVRHDCGACHGLHLTGGLGPALTADALRGRPVAALIETVLRGRPGTPMPPWAGLLSEADAAWIVSRLQEGFPDAP